MDVNDVYIRLETDFENRLKRSLTTRERWFVQWMAGTQGEVDIEHSK